MDDILDQAYDIGLKKLQCMVKDDDVRDAIAMPVIEYIQQKFAAAILAAEIVAVLVVIQTILLLWILFLVWRRR